MAGLQFLGSTDQRPNESIAYTNDVSANGSAPTVNSVKAIDLSDGADVSATVLSGSPTVSSDVITTPLVTALTDKKSYHIIINYDLGGNDLEDYFQIDCSDDRSL